MDKPVLEFYDIRSKTKFPSSDWWIEKKSTGTRTRYFAVAPSPSETEIRESWRIVSKDFAVQYLEKEETDENTDDNRNDPDPTA